MTYDQAKEMFKKLCRTERDMVTERQINEVISACEEAGVPQAHLYQWAGGYVVVRRMFVFTKRTDLRQYLWYANRHCEVTANRPGEHSIPDDTWDPDAMWFVDPFYEWGATFTKDLHDHARSNGWLEEAHADPSQTA